MDIKSLSEKFDGAICIHLIYGQTLKKDFSLPACFSRRFVIQLAQ